MSVNAKYGPILCVEDGCTDLAVGERFLGITPDGHEIVEAVCYEHSTEEA